MLPEGGTREDERTFCRWVSGCWAGREGGEEGVTSATWVVQASTLGGWLGNRMSVAALLWGKKHSCQSGFEGTRKWLGQDMPGRNVENMKNEHNLDNIIEELLQTNHYQLPTVWC